MFTNDVLADLNAAVVAAGGDETEDDEEEDEEEQGRDSVLELEVANRADTEEMTKLRQLAKEGSPGYSVDTRGLLRITDKVYVPEQPPTLAALLIRHVHEQLSTGHLGRNQMCCVLASSLALRKVPGGYLGAESLSGGHYVIVIRVMSPL